MLKFVTPQTAGRIVVGQAPRLPRHSHSDVFHWRSQCSRATVEYEKLSQSPVFNPGSCDLHGGFRGRQAELSEDRQELSDERQQGMQLWKELRLRLVSLATLS